MPRRPVLTSLQTSTINILNTIRDNASADYQQFVPEVTKTTDIPKVGEVLLGYPAMANQFLNALLNRIALVRINSMTFNNPYVRLKKGYLEFGETIENVFVGIIKAIPYNPDKGEARELKRYASNVKATFHIMNWRVLYPISIYDVDLKLAFTSINGVQDMIARLVDQVYTSSNVDEFLLFKYLMIKAISHGKMKPLPVDYNNGTDAATNFRGTSNLLIFPSTTYNEAGVTNVTPKSKQVIFMDSMYNAKFDVTVLASAFNMDKAAFMGSLFLIDDWTTFDMDRFSEILKESDGMEPVTPAELDLLKDVHAVVMDEDWFQVYDNEAKFTEKYVGSALYWNYFYHVWKTISHSPFHNAVAFVDASAEIAAPAEITVEVQSKTISTDGTTLTLVPQFEQASLANNTVKFTQTQAATEAGIGIYSYGGILIPAAQAATDLTLELTLNGAVYTAGSAINAASAVGTTVTFTPAAASASAVTRNIPVNTKTAK